MKLHIITLIIICLTGLMSLNAMAENIPCNPRQSDYNCLVCNCYHETRGETFDGMVAVAKVVLARFESQFYPNDICKVVFQPFQFSWTPDKSDNAVTPNNSIDKAGLEKCKKAVDIALYEGSNDILYYYNPDEARPSWAKAFKNCGTIESHTFLTPKDTPCPKKLGAVGGKVPAPEKTKASKREGRR